jgi:MFS family permease
VNVALSARAVLRRYYTVSLAYALAGGFLAGVYPLFLRSRGLDQLEINTVLAVYFAITFLTDVPTGVFADALGRRRAFVLGCALRALGFAMYFVSHAFVLFLVAEVIDAVGTTFCNGAIDAWGVDSLDDAGFTRTKDHLFSRLEQLASLGFMITALAGALVASVDLAAPWLLGAAGFALTGGMGVLLSEPRGRAATLEVRALPALIATRIARGVRRGLAVRSVRLLSVAEGIVLFAWAPYWVEWPLLFTERHGVGVWVVGWIFCVLSGARMIGAEIVIRALAPAPRRLRILVGLVVGAGVCLAAAGSLAARPIETLVALFLMQICLGAREPLAQTWFNEQVAAEDRATMLSFRSTLATAGASLGLLLGGVVADLRGIPFQWRVAGTMALLAAPCYLALRTPRPLAARR